MLKQLFKLWEIISKKSPDLVQSMVIFAGPTSSDENHVF
jgi:hypothetical protein